MQGNKLSLRGYGIPKRCLSTAELNALRAELTIQPLQTFQGGCGMKPPPKMLMYKESDTTIYIPKAFGLQRYGPPSLQTDDLDELDEDVSHFAGSLRDAQREPINAFMEACRDPRRRGGVLSLGCAAGKTVMALYCISRLRKKTLIVVHKEFLLHQWMERIQQFLPRARVGIIKAQVVDVIDKDIIIASLQSLSMKDYMSSTFKGVGFLIVDETHRIATHVFSKALPKISVMYTLGLSATVVRKDGMHKAFLWWLGDIVFARKREKENVKVRRVHYYSSDETYSEERMIPRSDRLNISAMVNNICAYPPRTLMVIDIVAGVIAKEPGRQVLVLSDRKAMLHDMKQMLGDRDTPIIGRK